MKKLLVAVLLLAVSAVPAVGAGPYVGASAGLFIPHESDLSISGVGEVDVEYDMGGGFDVKAGYDFDGFRVEAEVGYKGADVDEISGPGGSVNVDGADITVMSYMLNGYLDMKTNGSVQPFLGVGIGFLNGEIDDNGFTTDDTVFGYQLTAGLALPINKNLSLDLYYRFQGAASDFEDAGDELSYTSSNIYGGFRYAF